MAAGVLSTPGVVFAATDAANNGFNLNQIISAGVTPALVLALVLAGKLVPSGIVDSYKARAEQAEKQRDEAQAAANLALTQQFQQVVPALVTNANVIERLMPILNEVARAHDNAAQPARPSPHAPIRRR